MNLSQMRKGLLEGCVLQLLDGRSLYSKEIVTLLRVNGFPDLTEGTILPLMLRLDKESLFDTELVESRFGPNRKYYMLNDNGRKALSVFRQQWNELKVSIDHILGGEIYEKTV